MNIEETIRMLRAKYPASAIFQAATELCASEPRKIVLLYYIDEVGNFLENPRRNPKWHLAKAIFNELDKRDQFDILRYIKDEQHS